MLRVTSVLTVSALLIVLVPPGCTPSPTDGLFPGQRSKISTQATATPQTANCGETVTLTAAATADVDAGAITYAWLQTAGPGVSIANADQATASFVAPSLPSDQTLQFTVTTANELGHAGRESVTVLVLADPDYGADQGTGSKSVLARAGPDREVGGGSLVTLDGRWSRGSGLSYEWEQVDGVSVELENADQAVATFVAPDYDEDGDNRLEFELRVRDRRGQSDSDRVVLTVVEDADGDQPYPRVRITTSKGAFVVELNRLKAPITVRNFLDYVDDGFYDGTLFHRVIENFMIQGGGYLPGLVEKETRDPIDNESSNGLSNKRGTIAMARMSDPDSATSQFYINLVNNTHLDGQPGAPGYAVFGEVVEGMDIVDAIAEVETETRGNFRDVPVEDVVILSVRRIASVKKEQPGGTTPPSERPPSGGSSTITGDSMSLTTRE